jgi:hypothetical protein
MLDLIARLLFGCWFVSAPTSALSPDRSGWQQIYEVPKGESWLATVWASDEEWVAAGKHVVVRGTTVGIDRRELPGKTILGVDRVGRDLFALGADQLILRFDGKEWVEEHFEPAPPKASTRQKYAFILYALRATGGEGQAPLLAYGPWRVLVRQSTGTWSQPVEAERDRLSLVNQIGPEIHRPARCAPASWRWLRNGRAWFTCHDGRSFTYDSGKTEPTGTLPKACNDASDGLAERGTELNLLCDGRGWRSEKARWLPLSLPKGTTAIAASTRCLFAATERAVSKLCE